MTITDPHTHTRQQRLIFTERRLIPRLIDGTLTLIAWLGFIWLIYQGMVLAIIDKPQTGPRPFNTTLASLQLYLLIAVFYGGALILWARYNQYRFRKERRQRRPGLDDNEVARSFHISAELIRQLKKARVFTLHHNDNGLICDVEIRHWRFGIAS